MASTPALVEVKDADAIPKIFSYLGKSYTELCLSSIGMRPPLVMKTWDIADRNTPEDDIFLQEIDEVKFITAGESVWKNVDTGGTLEVNARFPIWFPKGSRNTLLSCKNLKVVCFEAVSQKTGVPETREVVVKMTVEEALDKYRARFVEQNPKSAASYQHASTVLPGGNTRSVLHYDPFPMVLTSGKGCHVTSQDGREYVDFVSEYSACMLGHSHPEIAEAVHTVMARGINLGGASTEEAALAKLLTERIPSFDKVRFCNSGTEANTMALTVAIHYTKRKKILAFESGYHGGFLGFDKSPLPSTLPFDFVMARYNDADHVEDLVDESFAAILVEPMQGVGGMIAASREFLQRLRQVADRTGAVLIFDEVVTSRLHYNALQSHYAVFPDMTTIGKFWGGGFSFGAFGGRADIMKVLEPGQLGHSGTFNNNAFSMTAGAVACRLITKEKIAAANALGDRLRDGINAAGRRTGATPFMSATGFGSMLSMHFSGPLAADLRDSFFFFMLDRGIYVARRGLIALNLMHTETHVKEMLAAVGEFAEEVVHVHE